MVCDSPQHRMGTRGDCTPSRACSACLSLNLGRVRPPGREHLLSLPCLPATCVSRGPSYHLTSSLDTTCTAWGLAMVISTLDGMRPCSGPAFHCPDLGHQDANRLRAPGSSPPGVIPHLLQKPQMCPVCNFSLILCSADGPPRCSGMAPSVHLTFRWQHPGGESFPSQAPLPPFIRGDFAFLKDSDKY